MTEGNTVELTLQANVADFERAIKTGLGTLTGQLRAASRTADTESKHIKAAMDHIGVRPFADIEREIRQLQRDYKTLASSGELSSRALTQANVRMREGIRALRSQQNGWLESLGRAKNQLLLTAGAVTGLALLLRNATQRYLQFEQAMAAVSSITDVSNKQIGALSEQVRDLSVRMGKDATQSAQALYDILSSGIAPDNAISVLEQSARAAVAGLTDTQTAARAGLAVINAYGKNIAELGSVFDVLFQTVKSGVTTLPELSASLGQALPVAAGAGVAFESLAAAIAALTKAGLGTAQAITGVRGAIIALTTPTPAAAKAFQELGIETGNFVETLRQIAALKLDPATLRVLVPDVEGRNAVIALTGNIDALTSSITRMQHAAGATDTAYAKIADTDPQAVQEFNAALAELQNQFGELVASAKPVLELLTDIIKKLEQLPGPVKTVLVSLGAAAAGAVAYELSLGKLVDAFRLATAGAGRFGGALRRLATLRGGLIAGVFGFTATKLIEGISLWRKHSKAVEEAEQRYRSFVEAQKELQSSTEDAADTQRLSREELKRLTKQELASYAERVRAAQKYYSSVRDLRSRQFANENGPQGVDPQALAAAREARLFGESLAEIKQALANREKAALEHRKRLETIKREELDDIRKALAGQIKAFDDANDKLKTARDEREKIAQSFRDLEAELAAPKKTANSNLTFLDIGKQFDTAREAFAKGDLNGALKQLARGREVIRALADQGGVVRQDLIEQTRRLSELADKITAAQVKSAQDQADKAKKAIEELVAKAQFLKSIQIGFDGDAAAQSAEALRARLKDILAENPIIVPVQIASPKQAGPQAKRADQLLGIQGKARGGLIRGPGTTTSDSILSWLSNGEYVIRSAAVDKYGAGLLDAINRLSLPGFATGGLVENLRIPNVSAPAPTGVSGTPVNLHIGNQQFQTRAAPDVAAALTATVRREALKAGRP